MSKKRQELPKAALKLAEKLLKSRDGGLEELRVCEFKNEEDEFDEEFVEGKYAEFSEDVEAITEELAKKYGKPAHKGKSDSRFVPLGGVFRYACWRIGEKPLFVAANHEDVGIPIILWLGSTK